MNLKDQELWKKYQDSNTDPYGAACVKVAAKVMEFLDTAPPDFDANDLIYEADRFFNEGITGFMAGAVATRVSECHARGEEFRQKWNLKTQIQNEGEAANLSGGVLNPAILTISQP